MTIPDGEKASPRPQTRADFWFGLGLVALGIFIAFESWRMPRFAELNVEPMTAPGLVPGVLGVIILVLGSILFIRAARRTWATDTQNQPNSLTSTEKSDLTKQTKRFFLTLTLCVVFAAGLVSRLPFWLATFLFISAFIFLFEWQSSRTKNQHFRALGMAVLQAAIVAFTVSYIFESIFLVRLP